MSALPVRQVARPLSEWTEEDGSVLWWFFPMTEAPYVGSPLDCGYTVEAHTDKGIAARFMVGGWPGYHTHWTPLPALPVEPTPDLRQMLEGSLALLDGEAT